MGVTYYIMRENFIWREFNLAIFYDSPNRQIKVLAKFSSYTVRPIIHISKGLVIDIFGKFGVLLKQHIKDSIPLPLATMGRLHRLVTVR